MLQIKKTKPVVYIRNELPEKYLKRIVQSGGRVVLDPWKHGQPEPEPRQELSACNVMLTGGYRDTLAILEKAPKVKWVQSTSVGVDKMMNDNVRHRDVVITNMKGCTSIPIAEYVLAMITGLTKKLPHFVRKQMSREWDETSVGDLTGRTVGIVGYGNIGYEIARRCKAFDMRVIGCRRNPEKRHGASDPADIVIGMDALDTLLEQSDFTVLALPSTPDTVHLFNGEKIEKMKPGSFLVNIGRGNLIVEDDLVACLQRGKIAGAALDVFEQEPLLPDHPFWGMENVVITPHRAFYSVHTWDQYMDLFLENLRRFENGEPLLNVVNKEAGY